MTVDVGGYAVASNPLDGGREVFGRHVQTLGIIAHVAFGATDACSKQSHELLYYIGRAVAVGVDGIVKSEALAAIGAKYGKTAAQVALRWLTQRGIVVIPKSTHKERMQQNFEIFDFSLTADEMAQIATMNQHDTGTINFGDPQFVKYLIQNYG